jgi:diaminopimelate epimerase
MTSADMGEVSVESLDTQALTATLSVGNPHLVLVVDDPRRIDVEREGLRLQDTRPGGINVEWIARRDDGSLDLVVYERGVGRTMACGSGSCAAAVASRAFGLTGDSVRVANPGGDLTVTLEGEVATLSGPASVIADMTVLLERDA